MKTLAGAGVFGLVPHPSTATVDSYGCRPFPPLWAEQEVDCPTTHYRRDASERMATRGELASLRRKFESAGH